MIPGRVTIAGAGSRRRAERPAGAVAVATAAVVAFVMALLGVGAVSASAVDQTFEIGKDWVTRTSASDNNWSSVAYGGGKFVAVGLGTNKIQTSSDGVTWTGSTGAAASLNWSSVTYGGGKFVAVASTASGSKQTMTSSDGSSWTLGSDLTTTGTWQGVAYGNGKFVAVGGAAGTPNTSFVMYSSDGVSWTAGTSPAASAWKSVVYSGSTWVAVAASTSDASKRAMTSSDGVTWTAQTTPNAGWQSVVYGASKFVAVSTGGKTMSSSDGSTWTQSTTGVPSNDWRALAVGQTVPVGSGSPTTRFVAVSDTGTGNRAMYSADGVSWTAGVSASDNNWAGLVYGNGEFVAVAKSGTGTRVMTSNGPFLTSNGATLNIVAPSGVTTTGYAIYYNTQARIDASSPWGIWGTKWPPATTSMSLLTYQNGTAPPCGVGSTLCYRPIGEQTISSTFVYKVTANVGGSGYNSPNLTVTRTA